VNVVNKGLSTCRFGHVYYWNLSNDGGISALRLEPAFGSSLSRLISMAETTRHVKEQRCQLKWMFCLNVI
jgi:hypothetical protein